MKITFKKQEEERIKQQLLQLKEENENLEIKRAEGKGSGDVADDLTAILDAGAVIRDSLSILIQSTVDCLEYYSEGITSADELSAMITSGKWTLR